MSGIVLIEPHYLGSLEYFITLFQSDKVLFEINDHFIKQTYRNRCYVHGPKSIECLTVPVRYKNHTPTKDVIIDYDQTWLRDHMRAIESYYGNSPFFDYFWDLFSDIWVKKPKYLIELNHDFMTLCLKIMQIDMTLEYTSDFTQKPENHLLDLRNLINPKKQFNLRQIYSEFEYTQLFGSNFAPNLSIIDLILCEGSRSTEVLRKSMARP
jgi:hypothetical protein